MGRTPDFESANLGSSPSPAANAASLREQDIAQIRRTLGALTSAVKCGEAWTPILSVEVQLAHSSLRSLEDTDGNA